MKDGRTYEGIKEERKKGNKEQRTRNQETKKGRRRPGGGNGREAPLDTMTCCSVDSNHVEKWIWPCTVTVPDSIGAGSLEINELLCFWMSGGSSGAKT